MFEIKVSAKPSVDEVYTIIQVLMVVAGKKVMDEVITRIGNDELTTTGPEGVPVSVVTPPPPPPPPAAAFAQTGTTVPPPPPPAGGPVELDAEGLPWNADIHAASKNKTQKGVWKARKNLDDNTKAAIVAQLRLSYPAPSAAPLTPPTPMQPVPPPPPPPSNGAVPPPPPPQAGPADYSAMDFMGLMQKIAGHVGANQITQADIGGIVNRFGLASPPMLAQPANAGYISAVAMAIDAHVAGKQ